MTTTGTVEGDIKRTFSYDAANRFDVAQNCYAKVDRDYDDLGRLTSEEQSIMLDGSGFSNGWIEPIDIASSQYDLDSNRGRAIVQDGMTEDLRVNATFDKLGPIDVVDAEYFGGTYTHSIANYDYFGPGRLQKNTLGNTAVLTVGYDGKRRIDSYVWKDATMSANTLVGFEYGYDDVGNRTSSRDGDPFWRYIFLANQRYLHHQRWQRVHPDNSKQCESKSGI